MLCSDLDGTMVGDDEGTRMFSQYWQDRSADGKSCLVYSTGRTLDQYLQLKQEKQDLLQTPDYLICAVGTRIYEGKESPQWTENKAWRSKLDQNWNTMTVKCCAEKIIDSFGSDHAHLRPEHEQNTHKITLGIKTEFVSDACEELKEMLGQEGVEAKLVYSGSGDWKYLDILARSAGKLESLEFVMAMTQFQASSTYSCGDSGNDIAMMEGENRAIIVGNAQSDLVDWYSSKLKGDDEGGAFKERVVICEENMARGILSGLKFFNVL